MPVMPFYFAAQLILLMATDGLELPHTAEVYLPFEYLAADDTLHGGSLVGTVSGDVTIVSGILGNAMYISGDAESNLYLGDRRDSCFWSPGLCSQGYTIAFWLNIGPKATSELYYISNGGQTYASYGIGISLAAGPIVKLSLKTNTRWWKTSCSVTKGNWLHFALTWTEGTGIKAYLNGQNCDEDVTGEENIRPTSSYNGFYLGKANKNLAVKGGEAKFDELLFWPEQKDGTFISALYEMYNIDNVLGDMKMTEGNIILAVRNNKKLPDNLGQAVAADSNFDCIRKCFMADDRCFTVEWIDTGKSCKLSNVIAYENMLLPSAGALVYGKLVTLT